MFAGAPVRVTSVRFRPDGKSVFAGLTNGKQVEWDISNEKIAATWNYHTGVVTGIGALKANGQLLTTSSDQTIGFASGQGHLVKATIVANGAYNSVEGYGANATQRIGVAN